MSEPSVEVKAKMTEITERTEDGGWLVRTNAGPVMFPPDCGALAVATAEIEARQQLGHTVRLWRRTKVRNGVHLISYDVQIDGKVCGCLLPDSVRRDWLFFPTREGRKIHGDDLFHRRFAMDLQTVEGRLQARAAICAML